MTSGRRGVARGFSRHSWLAAHQLWRRHTKDKIVDCHCLMGGCCLAVAAGFVPRGSDCGPFAPGYPQLTWLPAAVGTGLPAGRLRDRGNDLWSPTARWPDHR